MLKCWRSCAPGPAGLGCAGSVPILCIHYQHGNASPPAAHSLSIEGPDAGQLAWAGADLSTGFGLSSVFDGATG